MKLKIMFGPFEIDSIALMRDVLDDAIAAGAVEDFTSTKENDEYQFNVDVENNTMAEELISMAKDMGGMVPEINENNVRQIIRKMILEYL